MPEQLARYTVTLRDGRQVYKDLPASWDKAQVRAAFAQDMAAEGIDSRAQMVLDGPQGHSASSYEPSLKEKAASLASMAFAPVAVDQHHANRIGGRLADLLDWSPVGAAFGIDEGASEFGRGLRDGNVAAGLAGLGTMVLSAAPEARQGAKGLSALLRDEAGIFAGRGAKTANLALLARAEDMAGKGADRRTIWDETGWFKGRDDRWRFEIDDSTSSFQDFTKPRQIEYLGDRMKHPRAFEAYEDAPRITTVAGGGEGGSYQRPGRADPNDFGVLSVGMGSDQRSTTSHELQHFIQGQEDFARGGSPRAFATQRDLAMAQIRSINQRLGEVAKAMDAASGPELDALKREYDDLMSKKLSEYVPKANADPLDQYRRLAGEVEARNVQTRLDWTPEQRRATPPWETQDVADEDQIIRF